MQIIALVGFMGSGKDTAALHLKETHGFTGMAFADSLKDAVAALFCWDRELLDGKTKESREWREQVDPWWANRFDKPDLTPRWVLQNLGTETIRHQFHPDMWLMNVERRILNFGQDAKIVLTDCRFPNEIEMINRVGGKVVRVKRGPNPDWYDAALYVNTRGAQGTPSACTYGTSTIVPLEADLMAATRAFLHTSAHESEFAWVGSAQYTVDNDGTLDDLFRGIASLVR